MFRLKRVKQRKAKHDPEEKQEHICCCCHAMFASEDKVLDSTCPLCSKEAITKETPPERILNIVPCKSEDQLQENRKRLEHLMSHIDDVIDLTKQYKTEGIVSPSIEKFINSCNQVKEKIEDYANTQQPLCDLCRKALEATGKASASRMESSKPMEPLDLTCPSDRPTEEPPCVDSTYNLSPEPENKLGHFEKKFKEIVKVTRLQNEDGTISEEKQVITIKTERRNPRKPKTFDKTDSSEIFGNFGSGGHGGDGKGSKYSGPRDTKSEHAHRSQQMSEPKLRSCMSACQHKPASNRDATTNFSGGSCYSIKTSKVTLPLEDQAIGTHSETGRASTTTSCQMCCPNKSVSGGCGTEQVKTNLQGLPKTVSSVAVQACCKEVKINRPTEDRGTCCLPSCKGDEECPDKKETNDDKTTTTGTDALWRDTCTSTTDLNVTPSQGFPDICCQGQEPNKGPQNEDAPPKESCCTIKILMKPPKVCTFEQKLAKKNQEEEKTDNDQALTIRGSMFETLKRIIMPSYTPPSSSKPELTRELEIKNICKSCISKFSSAPSQKSSTSTAKQCQAKIEITEKEMPPCPSCSMKERSPSYDSESNKSAGVGSDTEICHPCTKSPATSMHSEKHVCCLAKKSSSDSFISTCCDLAANASQKSVCCHKSDTDSAPCFKTSEKSVVTTVSSKDAATNTKLSNRFDVRRAGGWRSSGKSKKDCSCRSEPNIPKNRCGNYKKVRKCQSFDDAGYYYFRW